MTIQIQSPLVPIHTLDMARKISQKYAKETVVNTTKNTTGLIDILTSPDLAFSLFRVLKVLDTNTKPLQEVNATSW